MSYDVFISYKSEDKAQALWVKENLEANNVSCWMAPESIPGGSNYAMEIAGAMAQCRCVVVVFTEKTQTSMWVDKEVELALNMQKRVLPFMMEAALFYEDFHQIDEAGHLSLYPGVSPENGIRLTGGASKSSLWTQIIADVLGVPVINPSVPDVACVGAAIIAGAGCGVFGSVREGCFRLLQSEKKTCPDMNRAEMYKSAFRAYRENAGLIGKFSKQ